MLLLQSGSGERLAAMLSASRARTLELIGDFQGAQWLGPKLPIVNPPLWEAGHLGWFEERWCLRCRGDGDWSGSRLAQADALYDSSKVPHDVRWDLPLPGVAETLDYLAAVRRDTFARLQTDEADPVLGYFATLSAFHEAMHAEALTYTRQTLAYPAPFDGKAGAPPRSDCSGDAEIDGGVFSLGAEDRGDFVFDNEKWAHPVRVAPFRMSRTAVTCAQFAEFVDDGGYREPRWWSEAGWHWREREGATAPLYWRKAGGNWLRRRYEREEAIAGDEPMIHVSWFEAEAWCSWAGRRLPSEAEWEFAAATAPGRPGSKRRYPWGEAPPTPERAHLHGSGGRCLPVDALPAGDSGWGLRQMIGNVWEWTADWFRPYPGFVRDPYAEYSEPWFGSHKVLRGGCFATSPELIRNTWRNFYTPDRRDVFAGFRSCAL